MTHTMADALRQNFLGNSPDWYKLTIVGFLILNPILVTINPFFAGWILVVEFIFTLAMALKCYPLQPGGLLAVQAIVLVGIIGAPGARVSRHDGRPDSLVVGR